MSDQKAGLGIKLLSFILPIIGIVLFFKWKRERPKAAKGVLIAAVLGAIIIGIGSAILAGSAEAASLYISTAIFMIA